MLRKHRSAKRIWFNPNPYHNLQRWNLRIFGLPSAVRVTVLVADQTWCIEVDRAPLHSQQNTGWKKNEITTKITPNQKLETTSGLTFIWPQENWMVNYNIGRCQYIAYSYTLKPIPCVFINPPVPHAICKLTFITEVLTVTSLPCRIVRCNSQEED